MYRLPLTRLDCLPCFSHICLANSCSSLSFSMTELFQALWLNHNVLSPPAVSICFIFYTLYSMFQGQEMCGPDVWKDQAEFTAMSAIRKRMFCAECITSAVPKAGNALCEEGVLRFLYLQGFKTTPCQGLPVLWGVEGSKTNCDLIGSLLAPEKTIALRNRLRAKKKKSRCLPLAFSLGSSQVSGDSDL